MNDEKLASSLWHLISGCVDHSHSRSYGQSMHERARSQIDEFTIIQSHIAEGANTIVKTMVDWNERTKQSNTTDKLWSLFFILCLPLLEDGVMQLIVNSSILFRLPTSSERATARLPGCGGDVTASKIGDSWKIVCRIILAINDPLWNAKS